MAVRLRDHARPGKGSLHRNVKVGVYLGSFPLLIRDFCITNIHTDVLNVEAESCKMLNIFVPAEQNTL